MWYTIFAQDIFAFLNIPLLKMVYFVARHSIYKKSLYIYTERHLWIWLYNMLSWRSGTFWNLEENSRDYILEEVNLFIGYNNGLLYHLKVVTLSSNMYEAHTYCKCWRYIFMKTGLMPSTIYMKHYRMILLSVSLYH